MAVDISLVLTSSGSYLTSESTSSTTTIEVNSYSFEVENPTTIGSGTSGAGAGKVKFQDLHIVKTVDKSSPQLFQALTSGAHFTKATLNIRKAGGTSGFTYLTYEFDLVYVTDIASSATSGGDKPMEDVQFTYGALAIKYVPQNPNGSPGTPITGGWNITTNSPS